MLDPGHYVKDLVEHLETTHKTVANELKAQHDEEAHARALQEAGERAFQAGDIVFLRAPPQLVARAVGAVDGTSTRLLPRFRPQIFKIHKMAGPQSAILADPDSGSTTLGFSQPVHVSRLRLFDLAELDVPIKDESLQLELMRGSSWVKADIVSQSATGRVEVVFADTPNESTWLDLASEEYRWLYPSSGAAAGQARRRVRVS